MSENLSESEYQSMRGRLLNQEESAKFTAAWFLRHPEYGKFRNSLNKPRFKRKRVSLEVDLYSLFLIDEIRIGETEVKVVG